MKLRLFQTYNEVFCRWWKTCLDSVLDKREPIVRNLSARNYDWSCFCVKKTEWWFADLWLYTSWYTDGIGQFVLYSPNWANFGTVMKFSKINIFSNLAIFRVYSWTMFGTANWAYLVACTQSFLQRASTISHLLHICRLGHRLVFLLVRNL